MGLLRALIYAGCVLCFGAMVAGYFGWAHPAFDSLSAFRVHLGVLTILFGLLLATMGGALGGLATAGAAALVVYTTVAQGFAAPVPVKENGAKYRLLQINVRFNNPTPKQLLQLIGRTQPDVITLQEVTQKWRQELATIKSAYPHQLYCAAHRKIGDVAILSRRPFVD
ncbi:MAG: endonuclease/exonuclease/phosphatase family protein, partial [Rhizobiaceae bacterium]